MPSLIELFQPICAEVQTEVQNTLKGLLGGMIRGYLPQKWIFATSQDVVTFCVDKDGRASILDDIVQDPDVMIKITHDYLVHILETRSAPETEPDYLNITFQTEKGRTAFGYLRKRFGL
ncbi:MAG: hypothetical protein KAS16_04410 [Thermoplasmata archaeon]|nr:hypothetical protein [Thermoplasmata archaeon]